MNSVAGSLEYSAYSYYHRCGDICGLE